MLRRTCTYTLVGANVGGADSEVFVLATQWYRFGGGR